MRVQLVNAVHLVSKRDGLGWPRCSAGLHAAEFRANFRDGIAGVDQESLLRQARRLLAERPRTRAELGRLLAERWPDADPRSLGYTVTLHLALCQVPPRGVSASRPDPRPGRRCRTGWARRCVLPRSTTSWTTW